MRVTKLSIKVIPSSSRSCIAGWQGESLRVRVAAPPERGKANTAAEKTVAGALGIPSKCVQIVSGMTSAQKVIEISSLQESEVHRRLGKGAP